MPLYDVKCTAGCGHFEDVFARLGDIDRMVCSQCGAPVQRLIRPVMTVGPMPSKPLEVKQIGRRFESNSELREYARQNGDVEVLSATSQKWRKHVDTVKEKAERSAKKAGLNDREDRLNYFAREAKARQRATRS